MILDMLGLGRHACIHDCLSSAPRHRLHLRRAAGGRLPARPEAGDARGPRPAASTPSRVLDLGIYIIISALIGAKLLLLVTDFRDVHGEPARSC